MHSVGEQMIADQRATHHMDDTVVSRCARLHGVALVDLPAKSLGARTFMRTTHMSL